MTLIVDDDEVNLNMIEKRLSRAGYKVVQCATGGEAYTHLASFIIDLVITDMDLNHISGVDVLMYVREKFGSLPVILMSGNPDNLKIDGFDGYLEKPFSMQELLNIVQKFQV